MVLGDGEGVEEGGDCFGFHSLELLCIGFVVVSTFVSSLHPQKRLFENLGQDGLPLKSIPTLSLIISC